MSRIATLASALRAFGPADVDEAISRGRMLALLGGEADPFARSTFSPGHFTASTLVLSPDNRSLLLIHHSKLNRWLQPGGHIDTADADPFAAAIRELREETGVAGANGDGLLFDLDIHPIPPNPKKNEPAHEHFDLRYLVRADATTAAAASDALDVRWEPILVDSPVLLDALGSRVLTKLLKVPSQHQA